jgi:hypothetical protein
MRARHPAVGTGQRERTAQPGPDRRWADAAGRCSRPPLLLGKSSGSPPESLCHCLFRAVPAIRGGRFPGLINGAASGHRPGLRPGLRVQTAMQIQAAHRAGRGPGRPSARPVLHHQFHTVTGASAPFTWASSPGQPGRRPGTRTYSAQDGMSSQGKPTARTHLPEITSLCRLDTPDQNSVEVQGHGLRIFVHEARV